MSLILLGILNSQAAAAGGAGAYDLLETQVLTSSGSLSFTGLGTLAADYKHLQIRSVVRSGDGANRTFYAQLNGDTNSNYSAHYLLGNGSAMYSGSYTNQQRMYLGELPKSSEQYEPHIIDILDFSNSSKNTTIKHFWGHTQTVKTSGMTSGAWYNTNAVTSITLFDNGVANLSAGSRFSLYGIKGA